MVRNEPGDSLVTMKSTVILRIFAESAEKRILLILITVSQRRCIGKMGKDLHFDVLLSYPNGILAVKS